MQSEVKPLDENIREFRTGVDLNGAFENIFTKHHAKVCHYFRRKGISIEDSEELAQDVFLHVFQNLGTVRDDCHFSGWLFAIARNIFNDEIQRRNAKKRGLEWQLAPRPDREQDPEGRINSEWNVLEQIIDKQFVRALKEEMGQLPGQMRRCVYLRFIKECSCTEIAAVLGTSASTVRVHLHRARKGLTNRLKHFYLALWCLLLIAQEI
jgi:RNA polymerase sigma-70 factor (ECF subfamily)